VTDCSPTYPQDVSITAGPTAPEAWRRGAGASLPLTSSRPATQNARYHTSRYGSFGSGSSAQLVSGG
jgi:hypothetical protein